MNQLSLSRRGAVFRALADGNSVRGTARILRCSRTTVLSLMEELGDVCETFQDHLLQNLPCKRIQCDEVWSFVGTRKQTLNEGRGVVWTWTAVCADSRLVIAWQVGRREGPDAERFMRKLKARLAGRVQLTTDRLSVYRPAIKKVFGEDGVDYAVLGTFGRRGTLGAMPAQENGYVIGVPDARLVNNNYVERQNLTMRTGTKRFNRFGQGHSKNLRNHERAVALYFMHYNLCRPHATLTKAHPTHYPVTPAMAAGISRHVWTVEEVCSMLNEREKIIGAYQYKKAGDQDYSVDCEEIAVAGRQWLRGGEEQYFKSRYECRGPFSTLPGPVPSCARSWADSPSDHPRDRQANIVTEQQVSNEPEEQIA